MKIHPLPGNRRITLPKADNCRRKELRRLPHVFAKVLELPFHSDADVSVVETPDSLSFTASVAEIDGRGEIRADFVEVYPGFTKIVIKGRGLVDSSATELEVDLWRIRLPDLVRAELASARCDDGELVVTVPKGAEVEGMEGERTVGIAV